MSYTIAFNTNGGESRADVTAATGAWVTILAAEPGMFLSGRAFDGWIVTGHDRRTAVYSTDGGATETALDSDPVIIAHDGDIRVKNLVADGGFVQLSARWRVQFGGLNAGCPTVWAAPFTPICSKGDVDGSTPLTLDVPVPVFAPYIPPSECACFTFNSAEKAKVNVTMHGGNKQNATGTAKVEINSTGDCCDGRYEVTPTIAIDIPECVTKDTTLEEREVALGAGGSIKYKLYMTNCVPHLDIIQKTPVKQFDGDINLCLSPSTFTIKATGRTEDGVARELDSQQVNLTPGNGTGTYADCMQYSLDNITLDLSGLDFGNGGSVFKDSTDGNLYTDGSPDPKEDTWYGGGLGDRGDNTHEDEVLSRGPAMRGYASPLGSGDHYVQYAQANFSITTDNGTETQTVWYSARKLSADENMPYGATGNLNMVMPTGFQWHERGLALNLCTFEWNPSGLLSSMEENGFAALVSPAPALHKSDASPRNGQSVGDRNASGLCIYPTDTQTTIAPGLSVKDGNGLRIFGKDTKTDDTEITNTEVVTNDRLGTLEVFAHDGDFKFNYDGKMVINDEKSKAPYTGTTDDEVNLRPYRPIVSDATTPPPYQMDTVSRDHDCTLPVVSVAGLSYWNYNDKGIYVYNTEPLTGDVDESTTATDSFDAAYEDIGVDLPNSFDTVDSGDVTYANAKKVNEALAAIAAVIVDLKSIIYDLRDGIVPLQEATHYVAMSLGCLVEVNAHFARSGVLIGVDTNYDSQGITRRYTPTEPTA